MLVTSDAVHSRGNCSHSETSMDTREKESSCSSRRIPMWNLVRLPSRSVSENSKVSHPRTRSTPLEEHDRPLKRVNSKETIETHGFSKVFSLGELETLLRENKEGIQDLIFESLRIARCSEAFSCLLELLEFSDDAKGFTPNFVDRFLCPGGTHEIFLPYSLRRELLEKDGVSEHVGQEAAVRKLICFILGDLRFNPAFLTPIRIHLKNKNSC